jgi:transcriptional regulator with XRE-family HTH domain
MPSIGDVVSANVRAERARLRLTQRQLAERLGWSVGTLSDLEAGRRRPAVDDLPWLCEALGVTLVDLLSRANPDDLRRLGLGD